MGFRSGDTFGDYTVVRLLGKSIKAIAIPEGVKSIDRLAFRDCALLATVTIPASVSSIGECPFARCGKLTAITVAKKNRVYKSVDGVLYTKDGRTLVECPAGISTAAMTIPGGVTNILRFACSDCAKLDLVRPAKRRTPSFMKCCGTLDAESAVALRAAQADFTKSALLDLRV